MRFIFARNTSRARPRGRAYTARFFEKWCRSVGAEVGPGGEGTLGVARRVGRGGQGTARGRRLRFFAALSILVTGRWRPLTRPYQQRRWQGRVGKKFSCLTINDLSLNFVGLLARQHFCSFHTRRLRSFFGLLKLIHSSQFACYLRTKTPVEQQAK